MNQYPIKCRISNDGASTRVDVYDDIGGGGLFSNGISASDFAATMSGVKGNLEVHINSGGGIVWDGIAIASAIRNHKGRVTTVVDGLAASIASVIAQAGQERVMQPGSMLMIHDAFAPFEGNSAEMAKMAQTLDEVSANLADQYAARCGGTAAAWRDKMRATTWFKAEDAVSAGLADRVAGQGAAIPAGYDLAAYHMPSRIAAALRSLPVIATTGPVAEASALAFLRAIVREEIRAADADGSHPPMTGTHTHSHPGYGAQGTDGFHSHEHMHDNDADHSPDANHVHFPADVSDFGGLVLGADGGWTSRDGKRVFDPDGDGDDDSAPAGDADHDYWSADGTQLRAIPPDPQTGKGGKPLPPSGRVYGPTFSNVSKPHGDVPYADPGYLDADGEQVSKSGKEGVARYPIDAEHVQAAWSYINQDKNAGQYTAEQLASIKSRVTAAMKQHGHDVDMSAGDSLAAQFLALVARVTPARAGEE